MVAHKHGHYRQVSAYELPVDQQPTSQFDLESLSMRCSCLLVNSTVIRSSVPIMAARQRARATSSTILAALPSAPAFVPVKSQQDL